MAIPVLLHFVRQMNAKQIPFGSLMFLTPTSDQVIKKRKLRDVLLMLARAAFIGLLAFVFARPFLPNTEIAFLSSDESTSTVILLDNSFSMFADGSFSRAKEAVIEELESAEANDEVSIVLFSDKMEQLTAFNTDPSVQSSLVSSLDQPSYRTTKFFEPLRAAEDILLEAQNEQRKVVLISDYQASGWSGAFDNWNLPAGVTFETVNVGPADRANNYIDELSISQRRGRSGEATAVRIDSRISQSAPTNDVQKDVTFRLTGEAISTQAIPATDRARLTFQHAIENSGVQQGRIELSSDHLPVDDSYYFTVDVSARPSVYAIDSRGRTRYSDTFFLRTAFDLGDDGVYDFTAGPRASLGSALSADHSVVFLSNLSDLSTSEVSQVLRWVEDGGYLILSQGNAVQANRISATLQALGVGSADAIVNTASTFGERSVVGAVDARHPIFSALAEDTGGVILRPQFRRYLRVIPDSSAHIIASFDSGDPFLVERRHGQGSVIVHASTINNAWTDFPVDEFYVPFLYQLAGYSETASNARTIYQVGDVVPLPGRADDIWEVRTPDEQVFRVEVGDEVGTSVGFFRETEVPGHYLAISGTERMYFSVNVDPSESVLVSRDEAEAYAAVASPFVEQQENQLAGLSNSGDERQSLWQYILAIVFSLMLFETVMASRRTKQSAGQK